MGIFRILRVRPTGLLLFSLCLLIFFISLSLSLSFSLYVCMYELWFVCVWLWATCTRVCKWRSEGSIGYQSSPFPWFETESLIHWFICQACWLASFPDFCLHFLSTCRNPGIHPTISSFMWGLQNQLWSSVLHVSILPIESQPICKVSISIFIPLLSFQVNQA